MKSVDALRKLVKRDGLILEGEEFDKCLDAIEEESRTRYGAGHNDGAALAFELAKIAYKGDDERYQFCRRVESAADNREDVTLWGVDYTALPVDADGVSIRLGDRLVEPEYGPNGGTVVGIKLYSGWDHWLVNCGAWVDPRNCRHHHAPTVEDVLREFADEVWNRYCNGTTASDSGIRELEAEYAAKLRLAEGVDE